MSGSVGGYVCILNVKVNQCPICVYHNTAACFYIRILSVIDFNHSDTIHKHATPTLLCWWGLCAREAAEWCGSTMNKTDSAASVQIQSQWNYTCKVLSGFLIVSEWVRVRDVCTLKSIQDSINLTYACLTAASVQTATWRTEVPIYEKLLASCFKVINCEK